MKSKKLAIVGVTAGLLAGAGAGFVLNLPGGVSAEKSVSVQAEGSDTTTPGSSIGGDTADDRGQHVRDALQTLVDDGTLSASQVDEIVAALSAAMPADGRRGGHMGDGHMGDGHMGDGHMGGGHKGGGHGVKGGELLTTAATAIGITEDELKSELQAGKTIAEVAVANGKTAKQVIDALVTEATADLTQRVTDMVNGVEPTAPVVGAPPTTVAGA